MVQEAPARIKVPTNPHNRHAAEPHSPPPGGLKVGRTLRGRILASGTGRAASPGRRPGD
jgi:hypothetical protein